MVRVTISVKTLNKKKFVRILVTRRGRTLRKESKMMIPSEYSAFIQGIYEKAYLANGKMNIYLYENDVIRQIK
jgi:hypothetical protein